MRETLTVPTKESLSFLQGNKIILTLEAEKSLINELSAFSRFIRFPLRDISVNSEKESNGMQLIYAVDFDILHAYLFPTLQDRCSQVSPALATYLFENSNIKLALPPGTLIELISYSRSFVELREISKLIETTPHYGLNPDQINWIKGLYNKLENSNDTELTINVTDDFFIEQLADLFSRFSRGFERLNALIANGQIVSFSGFHSKGTEDKLDQNFVKIVEGKLNGRKHISQNRRKNYRGASIKADSINVASVLNFNRSQGSKKLERNNTSSYAVLLTETHDILKLALDELISDDTKRGVISLPENLTARKYHWCLSDLTTAIFNIKLKERKKNPSDRIDHTLEMFEELSKLETETIKSFRSSIKLERALTLQGANPDSELTSLKQSTLSDRLVKTVSGPIGELFFEVKKIFRTHERQKPLELGESDPYPILHTSEQIKKREDEEILGANLYQKVIKQDGNPNNLADLLEIESIDTKHHINRHRQSRILRLGLNNQRLLSIKTRKNTFNLNWNSQLSTEYLLEFCSTLLIHAKEREISIKINSYYEESDPKNRKKEIISNDTANLNVANFLNFNKNTNQVSTPTFLEFSTSIGEFLLEWPHSSSLEGQQACLKSYKSLFDSSITEFLLSHTHTWGWERNVVNKMILNTESFISP